MDPYPIKDAGTPRREKEIRLRAHAVSRGTAMGKIVFLYGKKRQFYRISLKENQIDREIRRFRSSVRLAKIHLKKIGLRGSGKPGDAVSGIFDVHRMILEDDSFVGGIEEKIRDEKVNAEWAVKIVSDAYITKFKNIPDEHLRSKYADVEDVAQRLVTALGGGRNPGIRLEKNSIIAASEINPSTLVELGPSQPSALVTEHGGWTSHTFILAREIDLPAVTGIKRILRRVATGDSVIVDGYRGELIIHPSLETIAEYRAAANRRTAVRVDELLPPQLPTRTLDGREITIRANADIPSAYKAAKRLGAKGIGLYRSEFLFNQFRGFPSESVQVEAYKKIAALVGPEGVKIRTFDLHADQLVGQNYEKEKNPALGLRAVRLSLAYEKQFRIQLRSILAASASGNVDIILPMVSDVSQIRTAKEMIEREKRRLHERGTEIGSPRFGVMIEVPSAVMTIDDIAEEVDFLCLGTNDLVQYILAVDRDNETVSDWFHTLHPAVLRAIKMTIAAAASRKKPLIVCGEMAGSAFYTPILIGMGATELSMNVHSIARVRHAAAAIAYEEAKELIRIMEKCSTAGEAEAVVREHFASKWLHVFPNQEFSALGTGQ